MSPEVLWTNTLLPLARVVPFAYLYLKTRGHHDAYLYSLLVLLCGAVASTVNGATQRAPFAFELHLFFLLLTPYSILTCEACWPSQYYKTPLTLLFTALTVIFSACFLDDVMVVLLCYCLFPLAVYTFITGDRKWSDKGFNMLRVIAAVVFGILASLAFGGNDLQQSLAHVGVAISCTMALMVIPLGNQPQLQPIAVPSEAMELSLSSPPVISKSVEDSDELNELDLESS